MTRAKDIIPLWIGFNRKKICCEPKQWPSNWQTCFYDGKTWSRPCMNFSDCNRNKFNNNEVPILSAHDQIFALNVYQLHSIIPVHRGENELKRRYLGVRRSSQKRNFEKRGEKKWKKKVNENLGLLQKRWIGFQR